jgi:hypothetical protein
MQQFIDVFTKGLAELRYIGSADMRRTSVTQYEMASVLKNMPITQKAFNIDPEIVKIAMSKTYDSPIWTANWELPSGAYGEAGGPN